jgi:aminoglycoside phosphotransferase (APT) family kinase protein
MPEQELVVSRFSALPNLLFDRPRDRFADNRKAAADPSSSAEMADTLLEYMSQVSGIRNLQFVEPPAEDTDGWEAYSYRFQLASGGALPRKWTGPLMVRVYAGPQGLPRIRHEFAVLRHLQKLDFPAVQPVLLEESCAYFGGPFAILTYAPGANLLTTVVARPWRLFAAAWGMAETQAHLHRLPADGFPKDRRDVLAGHLEEMDEIIHTYGLRGLRPGLAWLVAHRPSPPDSPSILHLDFHPMNLIYERGQPLRVVDWPEADVGDVHADVGTTLMFLQCISPREAGLYARLSIATGRFFFRRQYLRAYRRRLPLDDRKLAYYRAWAALYRLCRCAVWRCLGPQATGSKPEILAYLQPCCLRTLERYFRKWTGVEVQV